MTIGELAAHERVQPPSMTRTVNCLAGAAATSYGARTRPTAARSSSSSSEHRPRPRAGRPRPTRRLAGPPAGRADPRRSARPCAAPSRSSSTSPRRTDPPPYEPHVPRPANPNYRLYVVGAARVEHRHLDAARRPGLAGAARARPRSGTALGITTGLQFLPILLLSPFAGVVADRFPKRTAAPGHPADDGGARRCCSASSRSPASCRPGTCTCWRSCSASARPSTPRRASRSSSRSSAATT